MRGTRARRGTCRLHISYERVRFHGALPRTSIATSLIYVRERRSGFGVWSLGFGEGVWIKVLSWQVFKGFGMLGRDLFIDMKRMIKKVFL